MRIIFFNQFFYPDSAATSQYLTDVARALGAEHSVTAICGAADYSAADADSGAPPPVEIIRTRNRRFSRRFHDRIASYVTFFAAASWHALRVDQPDVVVTLTTPPLIGLIGTLVKGLRGSRHVIWEMDVYPDIAIALGVPWPGAWMLRSIGVIARYVYRRSDAVIVLGECMKQRLISHGVPEGKIHIAENWADGAEITQLPFPAGGRLVLHYSGNFGLAHDLDTVRDGIWELRGDARFRFIFAGGGPRRDSLEEFCRLKGLRAVEFEPYCGRADLGGQLARGHVGLVTLSAKAVGSVVPSKVYGIMAAGRPILFIGPGGSEPARIIERFGCGWRIEPGDSSGLVDLLRRLVCEPEEIWRRGARAREAFEAHYERAIGVARIVRILEVAGAAVTTAAVRAPGIGVAARLRAKAGG